MLAVEGILTMAMGHKAVTQWLARRWLRMIRGQRDVKRWALRGSLRGVVGCRCDAAGCEKKFEGIAKTRCDAPGCRNLN